MAKLPSAPSHRPQSLEQHQGSLHAKAVQESKKDQNLLPGVSCDI